MLTGSQIRAARSLLDWSPELLADRAGVSYATVARAEAARSEVPKLRVTSLLAIKRAIEEAGIVFIDAGPDGGSGVRLRRS